MIRIINTSVNPSQITEKWNLTPAGKKVLALMSSNERTYEFDTPEQLHFELVLRANIVKASYDLNKSGVEFAIFAKSRCNPQYWILTDNGGFQLREGVAPANGIRDIFRHGYRYAFECATAMVIVQYKAMLDTIREDLFNRLFVDLLLWDGQYDRHLQLESVNDFQPLPGDIRYFKNPDVDPSEIEWQGENVVDLGDGTYYGHGIGIANAKRMVYMLNRHRRPGAWTNAFLTDEALRPDFKRLSSLDVSIPAMAMLPTELEKDPTKNLVMVRIGNSVYISV